jgi:hypothetical protein
MRLRSLLLAGAALLASAAPARAGDPIMPLGEVQKGMQCTAYSVLQGTQIETFDATVVDVVAGDPAAEAPRILVRFSGPAIERTGVGPGFSGSPIYCGGRVIGAISEAIGEYGGLLALATPIEAIVGQPVEPPLGGVAPAPAKTRSLAGPISVSGLSSRVGRLFTRAAKRGGKVLYAAPARPRAAAFPVQALRPGAAMSVGYSSGDVAAGSVGTVAYVDGPRVWSFGHPLEGTGRRSLFLQDAYVFSVVNNPVGVEGASTYKLAVPGHDVGVLSGDGASAVAGTLGALPDRFPMKVVATDQDTGRQRVFRVQIADETALQLPSGTSPLSLVGSGAIAQAATTVLGSSPSRQSGEMCARITVRERKKPLRFCNRYVTRGAASGEENLGAAGPMVTDFLEAVTALDEFNFATLHVTGVEVNVKVRRGLKQAFLLDAEGPSTVRRGRTARVRVKIQKVRGKAEWRTIKVRIPRGIPRGERVIALEGTPSDAAAGLEIDLGELLFGSGEEGADGETDESDEAGPRTIASLARSISGLSRYDGVLASFPASGSENLTLEELGEDADGPEGVARRPREVHRDRSLRLSGSVSVPVTVR